MNCPECGYSNPATLDACLACARPFSPSSRGISDLATVLPQGRPSQASGRAMPARRLADGSQVGERYEIRGFLGRGGMGEVYHAYDRELDRDVALKLIRSDIAEEASVMERFRREVQLASRVTHGNVLRVYDFGERDDLKYLSMQYVDGETLADVIRREGKLDVSRILAIFRQLCEGLAAAHEQGIMHRDLKPANVLLDGRDHVYIADFGLARSIDQSRLTRTGAVVGTPAYMSPEQVKGEPIDARSEVFALGIILYEMATGREPFAGDSSYAVMMRRLQGPPPPAGELNRDLPTHLRKVLDRCLAPDRDLRYGSVREILRDLEAGTVRTTLAYEMRRRGWWRPAMVVLFLTALAAGAWLLSAYVSIPGGESEEAAPAAAVPAVGVVPFENRTGDAALDWYGEAIARLVMDDLAQSRHMHVVSDAQLAALRAKAPGSDALSPAAATAGIAYLLTGDIMPAPGGLTVAARLTETREGREVAARRLDGLATAALVTTADDIAATVRKGLGLPPVETVDFLAADFAAGNPEAYELYLRGLRAFLEFRYKDAVAAFSAALDKAPDYTMARYRLAAALAYSGRMEEALQAIGKAAADASRLSDREARYVRAAEAHYARRYEEAIGQYRELIETYPYETEARALLSNIYMETNQYQEAIEQAAEMETIEPGNHVSPSVLGVAHLALREFSRAVQELQRYVEMEPGRANAHHLLGDAYRSQGELDLASQEYARALEIDPTFHFATSNLALIDVFRGKPADAERRLEPVVSDGHVEALHRINAAFDLAFLRRAGGRFLEAGAVLEQVEDLIAGEKVREAMALSVRGLCAMETGDLKAAGRLIDEALARSPGVPTRYLFARGLLELRQGSIEQVRRTAATILEGALPAEDPDRTEDKAAAYLTGMALLREGKVDRAVTDLERAVALSGYEYAIYRLGLASAYLAAGRLQEALAATKQSAMLPEPSDPLWVEPTAPRLQMELDRVRSLLALARVHLALGRGADAATHARQFLDAWSHADAGTPDAAEAARLASGTGA